ncbi:MAG TPA: ABC transporter permease [Streptosporangiaceae bacterium]|nr:ABC transporter permease [Streptosporangiaceae bacterium]
MTDRAGSGARAAALIAGKDVKARIRDRSALLIGVVVPLGLAFIFNAIFSGISGSKAITLGVVVADHGQAGQGFVRQILDPLEHSGLITVHTESSLATARSLAAKGTLNAVIVIPAGFTRALETNQPVSLSVIENASAPVTAQIAQSIAQAYASNLNRIRLSVATAVAAPGGVPPANLSALEARAAAAVVPLAVRDISASTKELDSKSFYAAGMAVFFLFFTVQFGVTSLLEERTEGTLARLIAAPIPRSAILAGKLLTSFALGVLSMVVLVVATSLLFGASWGNPVGVVLLIAAATLSATGIMALIATFAKNAEQAGNWQSVVSVILGLLGGTFFPVSQAPGILSKLTFVAPQAWFLRGLGDLRGGSLSVVWTPVLAMLAFAVVTGALALTRVRRLAEV